MTQQSFADRYFTVLSEHVARPGEVSLFAAADLGREMVLTGLQPEDMAEFHEQAVQRLAEGTPERRLTEVAELITSPFIEMSVAYGLALREHQERDARAVQEINEREAESRALAELSRIISSSSNVTDAFPLFADHLKRLISFDRIAISVVDWQREVLTRAYLSGIDIAGVEAGNEISLDEFAFREAVERGESRKLSESDLVALADRHQDVAAGLAAGLKSTLFVPMISGTQTVGTFYLWSIADDTYNDQDPVLVEQVAAQIAGAVASDQLRKAAEEEAQRRVVLAEIGRIVSSESSSDEVYPKFAETLRTLVRADRIVIGLVDPDGTSFTRYFVEGVGGPYGGMGSIASLKGTITGEIVHTRKPILLNEQNRMELVQRFPVLEQAAAMGLVSGAFVPMISSDRLIGVLGIASTEENAYGPREVELTEDVANQIAGAIANAQLHDATRREADERSVLAEIGRIIGSAPDVDDVYELFAECVHRAIPFDRLTISLPTLDDPSVWRVAHRSGIDPPGTVGDPPYRRDPQVASFTDTHRAPFVVDEEVLAAIPIWRDTDRAARSIGLQSMMVAPLIWDDQVIGMLNFRSALPDAYTSSELAVADRVARQITGAIVSSRLLEQTLRETREREVLSEISRVITSSPEIDEVLESFSREVRQLIPFDRITISTIDSTRSMIDIRFVEGVGMSGRAPGNRATLPLKEEAGVLSEWFRGEMMRPVILDTDTAQTPAIKYAPETTAFEAGLRSE